MSDPSRSPRYRRRRRSFLQRWWWAYRKLLGLYCPIPTALYRATRYALCGSSGYFYCNRGSLKIHLRN